MIGRTFAAVIVATTFFASPVEGQFAADRCVTEAFRICGSVTVSYEVGILTFRMRSLEGYIPGLDPQMFFNSVAIEDPCIDLNTCQGKTPVFGPARTISSPSINPPNVRLIGDATILGATTVTPFLYSDGYQMVMSLPKGRGVVGCNHDPLDPITGELFAVMTCGENSWLEVSFNVTGTWTLDDVKLAAWGPSKWTTSNSGTGMDCSVAHAGCADIDPNDAATWPSYDNDPDEPPDDSEVPPVDPGPPPTVVPEPSTVSLVAIGLLGIIARRRRRHN